MFLCSIIISFFYFYQTKPSAKLIIRIPPLRILLLAWAESTIVEFNSDVVFNEVGRNN